MSIQKVNGPVFRLFIDQALDAVGGTAPTVRSDWVDLNGWTDKVVTFEIDSEGAIDVDLKLEVSPKDYAALQALGSSVTTDDYSSVDLVTTHTGAVMYRVDSSDVDDLQRPMTSARLYADNDSATACTINAWLQGWS